MNDPKLARKRMKAVRKAKREGVPKDKAFHWVRDNYGMFEGHHLQSTIDRIYE